MVFQKTYYPYELYPGLHSSPLRNQGQELGSFEAASSLPESQCQLQGSPAWKNATPCNDRLNSYWSYRWGAKKFEIHVFHMPSHNYGDILISINLPCFI